MAPRLDFGEGHVAAPHGVEQAPATALYQSMHLRSLSRLKDRTSMPENEVHVKKHIRKHGIMLGCPRVENITFAAVLIEFRTWLGTDITDHIHKSYS